MDTQRVTVSFDLMNLVRAENLALKVKDLPYEVTPLSL